MTSTIKTVLLASAAVAVFATGPASAQTVRRHLLPRPAETQSYVYAPGGYAVTKDPYVVTNGAQYVGRDPDLQIRAQLLKDESMHDGSD